MCGIAGWVNLNENICTSLKILINMTDKLKLRGPDDYGYYITKHALLGHRRLIVVDPKGGAQPMSRRIGEQAYTIIYNGELYNTEELRADLINKGYEFQAYSDTEVLLFSYIEYKEKCLERLNGIFAFAIWDENEEKLFLARDPLGVKPLFYTIKKNSIIFASEIKAILANPLVEPILDEQGIAEIFGLGPARSLGSGVFKGIKEIPPGFYLSYDREGVTLKEYWKLKYTPHTESLEETIEHVRSLFLDAVKRQLTADVPVCTFLSGGLDSSAISAVAAEEFRKTGKGRLNTFSIDYIDNDIFFKANEFQPNSDAVWAKVMVEFLNSNHKNIMLDTDGLLAALENAVKANDLPGMADIDSSLYLFCKEVRKDATVALSGECADEIFGGYPWFRRKEDIEANTFPWSKAVPERKNILSSELQNISLEEFVQSKYDETIKAVPEIPKEFAIEKRQRELFYLNIKWFMVTLLTRKDRMSMSNSLEVRVPFADYRIVEYMFNVPQTFKFCDDREKGLLRRALKDLLPEGILKRKKSPYPKTHNPAYSCAVKRLMNSILEDKTSPLLQLINESRVSEIVESEGKSFGKPWFGQLMTGPQMLAYLIQINMWMKEYKPIIKI